VNPRAVFETLFEDRSAAREPGGSLLDGAVPAANRLRNDLGPQDRSRLEAYLADIRAIERRIEAIEKHNAAFPQRQLMAAPLGVPDSWEEHVKLMFELMALAYQSNLTRVVSFMLARELSTLSYPQIGVADGHHPVSHNNNVPEQVAKKAKIDIYHLELFASFLQRLQSTPDGDGNLLDHSLFLYGSGMSNGNQHTHDNLPILLVGGAAGRLAGDRHIRLKASTPLSNLMITLLDKAGVATDHFGESSGRVEL
jgi:hypothetical protein